MDEELKTISPEKVHFEIETMLSSGSNYLDAIIEYANNNNLEIETVANVVKKSKVMKEKIRVEANNKRLLKKDDTSEESGFFD